MNERRRIVRHIEALRMMAAVKVYVSNVMRDEVISALREVESQIRSGQHR